MQEKIKNIPLTPGVYIMKDSQGFILYVGKASSLRKRVQSYFRKNNPLKTEILIDQVVDIEYIQCNSPQQALILEAALIKENKPKYNITLKDDKTYPYIEISNEDFPRVFISRPRNKLPNGMVFGPYTQSGLIQGALKLIRKVFPFRSCRNMPKKACLFFHINLCPGPCEGRIKQEAYKNNIENVIKILRGDKEELIKQLEAKMASLAKEQNFEAAANVRDTLTAVLNLYGGKRTVHKLMILKELLNLPKLPIQVEGIDISNLAGKQPTGSVVVFRDGQAYKNDYRRYIIKEVNQINDYAMIKEVVLRRYRRLKQEGKKMPDLVIIDGGKGQVQAAKSILEGLELDLPLIGLAKKNEEIWFAHKPEPVIIARDNPGLQFLQEVRDEAHRFARNLHILRRRKSYYD